MHKNTSFFIKKLQKSPSAGSFTPRTLNSGRRLGDLLSSPLPPLKIPGYASGHTQKDNKNEKIKLVNVGLLIFWRCLNAFEIFMHIA